MPTCSFCKNNYKNPRGLTLFTLDGRSVFYCSSKCRRNADLKRDPKKTNWVKREKKEKVEKKVEKKEEKKEEVKVEEKKSEIKKEKKEEVKKEKKEKVEEEIDEDDDE
ncbi:MAG: hypothetical protein ABIH37_03255 [archaeon]